MAEAMFNNAPFASGTRGANRSPMSRSGQSSMDRSFGVRDPQITDSMSIDEQSLINALEANLVEADTIQGSEISEQRQRNHVHYAGDRLGNEKKGRSHHMSMDVLDSVESQKAYYAEAHNAGRRPLAFMPENRMDTTYQLATEYVTDQFWEKNPGETIVEDCLHDAFVAKRCVVKVEWMEDFEEVTETYNVPPQQVMPISMQPGVVEVVETPSAIEGLVTLIVTREIDRSYAEVEVVQPERYYRDPNVAYIHEATFAGMQEDITRWELMEDGYDEDEVYALSLDYRFRQNEEDAARKAHDSSWSRARRFSREPEQEIVTVYYHYAYIDLSNFQIGDQPTPQGTRLYKFAWSQGKLLTLPETMDDEGNGRKYLEVVDGMPFFEWVQYKISHAEQGLCEADLQGDIQWTKSNLRRLIIDNAAMGNTSRWKARHNYIKNPRELLDNNIGAVLWVKQMDALEPLETPPISPVTFNLLETLDVEKENRTGLSRLAKGMNTDALSHQNAADMVQRLTNASNRRVLKGVRNFATQFLKPIYMHIYNLGRKYDSSPKDLMVQGQMVRIVPTQFPERSKLKIKTALTPDEGREQSYFLMGMHGQFSADPVMGEMYGPQQRFALWMDIMDMMDVEGSYNYLMNPASPQYQQLKQQQAKIQEQQMQMTMIEPMLKQAEHMRKMQETQMNMADKAADNLREDDKFAEEIRMNDHEIRKDWAEIQLEDDQARAVKLGED